MVARWAHKTECFVSSQRSMRRLNRRAGRAQGVIVNVRVCRSVGVEFLDRTLHLFHMLRCVSSQQRFGVGRRGGPPFPVGMVLLEQMKSRGNALRAFGMPRR